MTVNSRPTDRTSVSNTDDPQGELKKLKNVQGIGLGIAMGFVIGTIIGILIGNLMLGWVIGPVLGYFLGRFIAYDMNKHRDY